MAIPGKQKSQQNLTNMGSYCLEIIGAVCVSQTYYQTIETVDSKKNQNFPRNPMLREGKDNSQMGELISQKEISYSSER